MNAHNQLWTCEYIPNALQHSVFLKDLLFMCVCVCKHICAQHVCTLFCPHTYTGICAVQFMCVHAVHLGSMSIFLPLCFIYLVYSLVSQLVVILSSSLFLCMHIHLYFNGDGPMLSFSRGSTGILMSHFSVEITFLPVFYNVSHSTNWTEFVYGMAHSRYGTVRMEKLSN